MITTTQQGPLGENEFWKIVVVDTNGELEPRRPLPDDERIDFVLHPRGAFDPLLAFQVKTALQLRRQGRADLLQVYFTVAKNRLITHPRFWYLLALFERQLMTFQDPLFLVPSSFLHRFSHPLAGGHLAFMFKASMDPQSRDKWVPYRTSVRDLGARIQEILRSLPHESPKQRLEWDSAVGLNGARNFGRDRFAETIAS